MAASLYIPKTKMSIDQHSTLTIFITALIGAGLGVVATLAVAGSSLQGDSSGSLRTLSARPTSAVTSCVAPGGSGGAVLGASTGGGKGGGEVLSAVTSAPVGGMGAGEEQGGSGGGGSTVINKIIGGLNANTTATISGNGADSTNTVKTVNKSTTVVKNDNDVRLTNNNPQKAESGDAESANNVGDADATSGDAANSSTTNMNVSITN